jgi:hypothetical protein
VNHAGFIQQLHWLKHTLPVRQEDANGQWLAPQSIYKKYHPMDTVLLYLFVALDLVNFAGAGAAACCETSHLTFTKSLQHEKCNCPLQSATIAQSTLEEHWILLKKWFKTARMSSVIHNAHKPRSLSPAVYRFLHKS